MDNIEYPIKEAENKLAAVKLLFEKGFYKEVIGFTNSTQTNHTLLT